jgi:hypothetical protein
MKGVESLYIICREDHFGGSTEMVADAKPD